MRVFKASEWKDANGRWHVADVSDLKRDSAVWWIPARFLNISLEDYILMLINDYHAHIDAWFPHSNNDKSLLLFSWSPEDYQYAHKYYLWINRIARNKNWTI